MLPALKELIIQDHLFSCAVWAQAVHKVNWQVGVNIQPTLQSPCEPCTLTWAVTAQLSRVATFSR